MAKISDAEMFAQFQAFQAFMANQQVAKQPVDRKSARLATKDQKILRGFARKGIKGVVLMDRSDKAKPYNVKPFKAWLAEGRVVQKGQHGVSGLFHVSQTEALPQTESKPTQPKAEPTAEPKAQNTVAITPAEFSRLATKFRLSRKNDNQPSA